MANLKVAVFLCTLLLVMTLQPQEAPATDRNVLLLHSYHAEMPWSKRFYQGFNNAIQQSSDPPHVYSEYLDIARFKNEEIETSLWNHLATKYQNTKIDVLVAEDGVSAKLIEKYGKAIFPSAKAIYAGSIRPEKNQTNPIDSFWLPTVADYSNAISLILKTQPDVKTIRIISDQTESGRKRIIQIKQDAQELSARVSFEYQTDFTLDELLSEAATLPKTTALLYTLVFEDNTGRRFIPREVLKRLSESASVPTYSLWDSLLGVGTVGGYLVSAEKSGEQAAELSLRLSRGETVANTGFSPKNQSGYFFDGLQLKRWGISLKNLPEGSRIINPQIPFFEKHYKKTVAVASFLLAQAILIIVLHRSRKKVRMLAEKLSNAKDSLESTVYERTKDLQQLEERFRTLFEKSLDTILLLKAVPGEPPVIHDINPEGCRGLGYEREDLVGKSLADLNTEESRSKMPERMKRLEAGETIRFETRHIKKNGETFPLEVVSKKIMVGSEAYYLSVERDISERKMWEQQMRENEERLEELVTERTEKLERTVRLMAGREVRMADLKKEIQHLQAQLEALQNQQ